MHVASDIPTDGYFISNTSTKTQEFMIKICDWTKENKMLLNKKRSNAMLFNFTNKFQFAARIKMEDD